LAFVKMAVAAGMVGKSGLVTIGTGNQRRQSDFLRGPAAALAHGTVTFFG